jgi:1,4-dihydroxy-6-naphthoate synthase
MFYALDTKKIRTGNLKFTHVLEDIETLNQKALKGIYDITAISFHAYAYLGDRYLLLPCGGSFGEGYGPIVVARSGLGSEGLKGKRVAIPGKMTSAYLALRLYEPEVQPVETPFDHIFDRVVKGEADAGVVINEGQLTYVRHGLTKVVDLGEERLRHTGLPLPLGGNAILRSLDSRTIQQAAKLLRESILYALDHREEALAYAQQFARGLEPSSVDRFISLYVNQLTVDYGDVGRQAIQTLLDRGFDKGLIPRRVNVKFVQ